MLMFFIIKFTTNKKIPDFEYYYKKKLYFIQSANCLQNKPVNWQPLVLTCRLIEGLKVHSTSHPQPINQL